jgi:excisionase family DNA binding protein
MTAETATDALEPLYSLSEARQILGISRTSIYRLIERGDLAVVELGGRRLVEPEALRKLIDSRRRRRDTVRSP